MVSKVAVAGILLSHAVLLIYAGRLLSPVDTEMGHLAAGVLFWEDYRTDLFCVNPPLTRIWAAIPIKIVGCECDWTRANLAPQLRPEFLVGEDFVAANGSRTFTLLWMARSTCSVVAVVGGVICFWWGSALNCSRVGLWALCLWCCCPNIIANAATINPDCAATCGGLAASFCFWRWCQRPDWWRAFCAGAALGAAILTKTTWLVLIGLWPMMYLIFVLGPDSVVKVFQDERSIRHMPSREGCFGTWNRVVQLSFTLVIALYVLNLGYGFEGSLKRLRDFKFVSNSLTGQNVQHSDYGNRFSTSWVGALPVPAPEAFVVGIDIQKSDFERKSLSYLRGELRYGGWWYYYLYAMAVKIPLGTWVLIFMAAWLTIARPEYRLPWRDEMALWAPCLAVLLLVSSQTGMNKHFRYVLPALPYLYIFASRVFMTPKQGRGDLEEAIMLPSLGRRAKWLSEKWIKRIGFAALAWSVISSVSVYPHSISYFNELAGGPKNGHAHLLTSNIDFGQDLLFLKKWLDEHPEARPLHLGCWARYDPRVAGIEFTIPPECPPPKKRAAAKLQEYGPLPGWHALSVSFLRGYEESAPDGKGSFVSMDMNHYTYFQHFEPVGMAGYSIYIYRITLDQANSVRATLGLPAIGLPGALEELHSQQESPGFWEFGRFCHDNRW